MAAAEDLKFLEGYKAVRSKFFPKPVARVTIPSPPPKPQTEGDLLKIWIKEQLATWKQTTPKRRCDRIKREVCIKYDLSDATLLIEDRERHRILARAEYYCRLRMELGWSYPMIANHVGRDNKTIIHAVKKYAAHLGLPDAAKPYPYKK